MPFPRDRFARAGASAEQLGELEAAYDALSPTAQASYGDRIAPLSDYEISEQLLAEPVDEVDEVPEPEVAAPPSSSGSSSSGSSSSGAGSTSSSGPGSDAAK
jgi:hypothetical protein